MAYFNLHEIPKLIFQLNLIVGNSLDESVQVLLHRPQCWLIDCAVAEHDYGALLQHSANEHLSECGRQELQVLW